MSEEEDERFHVGIKVTSWRNLKGQKVFDARVVTDVYNGEAYAEEGANFGHGRGPTRSIAIAALKETLEDYPVDFNFIPLKQLRQWNTPEYIEKLGRRKR